MMLYLNVFKVSFTCTYLTPVCCMPHQSDLDLIMLKLSSEAYKLVNIIIMQFYPSVM